MVEWESAGETEQLAENMSQLKKPQFKSPGIEPETPGWEAWVTERRIE
jgi:hypothetical protein